MSEAISQDIKRSPGRPKNIADELPAKKGKRSWKPASLNEFNNKEPGYRYRMVRKDADNLAKKEAEGWEKVSAIHGNQTKHNDPQRIDLPKPMTSVQEGKDWILARIPEDMAVEREQYYNHETERRTAGLTAHIKKETSKHGTDTHGNITISSRTGTQTIE